MAVSFRQKGSHLHPDKLQLSFYSSLSKHHCLLILSIIPGALDTTNTHQDRLMPKKSKGYLLINSVSSCFARNTSTKGLRNSAAASQDKVAHYALGEISGNIAAFDLSSCTSPLH